MTELRGIDLAGNIEEIHAGKQTVIQINGGCSGDEYDNPLYNDNRPEAANPIEPGQTQVHNFCPTGDQDWFVFVAEKDTVYRISITPSSAGTTGNIFVYEIQIFSH